MKTRQFVAGAFAALALISASASFAAEQTQPYRYGQKLDVAEVISLQEADSANCGVVEAQMTYRDSTGALQSITYLKQSDSCHNQG